MISTAGTPVAIQKPVYGQKPLGSSTYQTECVFGIRSALQEWDDGCQRHFDNAHVVKVKQTLTI